jgi:hypothetical protein
MFWPCETRTSTCRNFATISSGLYPLLAIRGRELHWRPGFAVKGKVSLVCGFGRWGGLPLPVVGEIQRLARPLGGQMKLCLDPS